MVDRIKRCCKIEQDERSGVATVDSIEKIRKDADSSGLGGMTSSETRLSRWKKTVCIEVQRRSRPVMTSSGVERRRAESRHVDARTESTWSLKYTWRNRRHEMDCRRRHGQITAVGLRQRPINANRGPWWQLFARAPLLTRDKDLSQPATRVDTTCWQLFRPDINTAHFYFCCCRSYVKLLDY